jgi:subtilisin family serine protease
METRGHRRLRPRQRSTRRVTFLSLLLLAVGAPAGFALAGESSRPYIVVFDSDAMSVATSATTSGLVLQASAPTAASATTGERREVDGTRVRRHVAEIEARTQVRAGNVYTNAMGGFSAALTGAQLRALQNDASVAAIVPDEEISLDVTAGAPAEAGGIRTTTSPTERVPAGVRRIGAQRSTIAGFSGQDARVNADVAIIDTGIQRDHPDLNVVGGYNCTGRNRDNWDDVDGHGTHVAGIVGALDNRIGVTGVAPGARLWSVKVLGPHGSGRLSWLVCGIDWVTSQRERGNSARPLFEVANMSISFSLPRAKDGNCGAERHDAVHLAICRSVSRGTVYVVAAGNESHNARLNRPAAYDEVITVSALADYDGRGGGRASDRDNCPYWTGDRDDAFTSFSNWGPDVDLIAPGRCVLSTYKKSRYAWMSGTSMASPHVTGAVALYRSAYPRATPQQVRLALQAVATSDWRTASDPDSTHEKAVWVGGFRTMPDFRLSTSATAPRASSGSEVRIAVSVTRVGGFDDSVWLSLMNPPAGFHAASTTTTASSATLAIRVDSAVPGGRYMLTVRGVSGDVERVMTVAMDVDGGSSRATFTSPPINGPGFLVVGDRP